MSWNTKSSTDTNHNSYSLTISVLTVLFAFSLKWCCMVARRKILSTLGQVMACFLMAPGHNPNQCWPNFFSVSCSAILMDMYKIMLMKNCSIRLSYLTLNMLNCFLNIIKALMTCHIISWDLFNRKIKIHHEATLHVNRHILSISCLLLSCWLCEPGHQQAWYWKKAGIFRL